MRKDQCGTCAKLLQLIGLALLRRLKFHVDQLASGGTRLGENVELRGDGAPEFASAGDSAASRDHRNTGMSFQKVFDLRKGRGRLRDVV